MITICLATYNGEKYLKEQLDSLLNQTYQNFKIIAQDDCSSDDSLNILKSYKTKIDIDIYSNKKNLGYIKNFESLLKRVDTPYIAICDQDDIWELNKLEILMSVLKDNILVYSNSLLINSEGVSLEKTLSQKLKNNFIDSDTPLNFLFDNSVSAHAVLFKKSLLKKIFPFPQHIYFDAWIAANAANNGTVHFVNKSLVRYRRHSTNTLGKKKKKSISFRKKLTYKVQKKENDIKSTLLKIDELLLLNSLNTEDAQILYILKSFYLEFNDSYFNFGMFLFLFKHKEKFFKITQKSFLSLVFKKSIGKKLYKIAPFL